jgi:hypothetical protein
VAARIAVRLWEIEEDKKFVDGLRRVTNALKAVGVSNAAIGSMTVDELWVIWEDLADIKARARHV